MNLIGRQSQKKHKIKFRLFLLPLEETHLLNLVRLLWKSLQEPLTDSLSKYQKITTKIWSELFPIVASKWKELCLMMSPTRTSHKNKLCWLLSIEKVKPFKLLSIKKTKLQRTSHAIGVRLGSKRLGKVRKPHLQMRKKFCGRATTTTY
jgi:hypothetical protein